MSLREGIASPRQPRCRLGPAAPGPGKKKAAPEWGTAWGKPPACRRLGPCYFGVPCTASVTTARVRDGASISRKVYT